MPISDWNLEEKDSVTSCAPTNSPTPIWTLGQPLMFGFETIRTIGTCIYACMHLVLPNLQKISEDLKKSDNWDPTAYTTLTVGGSKL